MGLRSALLEPSAHWSRFLGRWLPALSMRADWNLRARKDAEKFIAGSQGSSAEEFWRSGRTDLDDLVLRGIELDVDAEALEIGCGLGRLLRPLSERIRSVSGVDISPQMVRRAREALKDRQNVRVETTRGKLNSFPQGSVDFVYSYAVFQHVPSEEAVLRYLAEAARVLKGLGVFRFQVDSRPRHEEKRRDTWFGVSFADPPELVRLLDSLGFETLSCWGEHTHYWWITARRRRSPDRPDSKTVRVRRQEWCPQQLWSLLDRLGLARSEAQLIISGTKSPRQVAERFVLEQREEPPEKFVARAYQVLLGREADPGGLDFYVGQLRSGVPSSYVVDCLVSSRELEEKLRPETPSKDPPRGPAAPSPSGRGSG